MAIIMPVKTGQDDIAAVADVFAEELANWSPDTISAAFREHARMSRYWPTLCDIIDRCRYVSQSMEYKRQRKAVLPMREKPEATVIWLRDLLKRKGIGSRHNKKSSADSREAHAARVRSQAEAIRSGETTPQDERERRP